MLENNPIKPVIKEKTYKGIGGWLILVIISLILTPLLSLLYIVESIIPILDSYNWTLIKAADRTALLEPLLYFELIINSLLIIVPLLLLFMMFKKSRKFPKFMIIYLVTALILNLIDAGAALYVFNDYGVGEEVNNEIYQSIARTFIFMGIWIPYFLKSKRVKATFLEK
ncbi:DUF2569 domain-containing protein [Salirhabdus sp. Marseille-P4669]|uniref:DUF2569 domain-containing protein n=1 Tax=Salirhabdus sp. Marseille-P4669 TaxID=2042310 RepID=UPI001359A439|nr:DUF2569 domain-containing protein [Salirhabdus sp. Marseille-P4669]